MANLQSLFPKAVNVLGEVKHAERNLWRNVLIVALEDAIGKGWRDYNAPTQRDSKHYGDHDY